MNTDTRVYGKLPIFVSQLDAVNLSEVMYFLYLPVRMEESDLRLPPNLECLRNLIATAENHARYFNKRVYKYTYLSARKGWATPDNPLNRPGWHCDGFGTDDLNYVWWVGPGTRFAFQPFDGICSDHNRSLRQFDEQVRQDCIHTFDERGLYQIDPSVVHATPIIPHPGCMRQYVKVSLSDHQYNLENNSHNYAFDYHWPMHPREVLRNDPHKSQLDYVA